MSPGPMAAWRLARAHCDAGCFAYHATWPLVRAAGLKATPRWHTAFYREQLHTAALLDGTSPVRALVAGAADHTMTAVLADLIGRDRLLVEVIDQCDTPLHLARRWAQERDVAITTRRARIPLAEPDTRGYDLVVTDGLLSLLPSPAARDDALRWAARQLTPTGLLLYTTRHRPDDLPLEFDALGRAVHAAAALTWHGSVRARRELAVRAWRRPARSAAYDSADQLHRDLRRHFDDIELTEDRTPPTPALAAHRLHRPAQASVIVRARAAHPTRVAS